MLAIEPARNHGGDEELGAIGVGAGVSHGQEVWLVVLVLEVLVGELVAVDGLASGAVVVGEVASLQHEIGDDTVETRTFVAESLLSRAQGAEIFGRLGNYVVPQLEHNPACPLAIDGDVEITPWSGHLESRATLVSMRRTRKD